MKVGIIVHSQTGHTLEVAEILKNHLLEKGMEVVVERVLEEDEKEAQKGNVVLKQIPNTDPYDVLIFGGPVWAFSPSMVMAKYLRQLPALQGKKVGCFVTQSFPFTWLGGNRSAKAMGKICRGKGGEVYATGAITWSKKRQERIEETVNLLSKIK
jgi:NAD(P)H dehydrogenase (quinone)